MARNKITVVGAGFVGATLAQRLAEMELGDVVLVDVPQTEGMPAGKSVSVPGRTDPSPERQACRQIPVP